MADALGVKLQDVMSYEFFRTVCKQTAARIRRISKCKSVLLTRLVGLCAIFSSCTMKVTTMRLLWTTTKMLWFLNSSITPTKAEFYQVKTASSQSWTPKSLTSRKQGMDGKKLPSILGKLYNNYVYWEDATRALGFVSNVTLSAKDTMNRSTRSNGVVRFASLCKDDAKEIFRCNRSRVS